MSAAIRPERTFECYSRGFGLVMAIRAMWRRNEGELDNRLINQRIQCIVLEYDLTKAEWHYWCRQSQEVT